MITSPGGSDEREMRGWTMVATVIAFAVIAVLTVLVMNSVWQSSGIGQLEQQSGVDPNTVNENLSGSNPGAVTGGGVVGAAGATVVSSHATAAAAEMGAAITGGADPGAAAASVVSRYPVTSGGATITATTRGGGSSVTVVFSDGTASQCVTADSNGARPGPC